MQVPTTSQHIVQKHPQVVFACVLSATFHLLVTAHTELRASLLSECCGSSTLSAAAAECFGDVTGTSMMYGSMTQKSTSGRAEAQLLRLHQQRGAAARWPYMAQSCL